MVVDTMCLYCHACARTVRQCGCEDVFMCPLDCPQFVDKRTKSEYISVPNALNFAELAMNWAESGMPHLTILHYSNAAKYRERIGEVVDSVISSVEWDG